ncbi:unnamed protein product [Arabis nemorensis]|uniref:Myb-like domain-containing protein n=1 Tax=Arabis nemorensis TaxID=586526 RepID=A0A565BPT0_9BRAS|nr:unnamed protein product [Arabis nemorensis]
MMNPSGSNDEINHRNPFSGNSPPSSSESSVMKHQSGIAMNWTSEEQAILDHGLIRYSSEPSTVLRYAKIALELENKNVRDVAMRCRWKYEIIDMVVASNSAPYLIVPSPLLRVEHGITNELIEQNRQMFNQITENFANLMLKENFIFFSKIGENIRKLLKDLNENVPETMKHMPQLPEMLRDDLVDAIFLPSNLP